MAYKIVDLGRQMTGSPGIRTKAADPHEMRTPLTSTLGFVDNMLDGVTGALSTQQVHYLTRIKDNIARLTRLISDLLDLTLPEEGQLRLHVTETALPEVVRETVDSLQPLAHKKSVQLRAGARLRSAHSGR